MYINSACVHKFSAYEFIPYSHPYISEESQMALFLVDSLKLTVCQLQALKGN